MKSAKKITLSEFVVSKARLAIHCSDYEQAKELCKELDSRGIEKYDGKPYSEDTDLFAYLNETCYVNDGDVCNTFYCRTAGYTIYEFEDVDLTK